MKDKIFRSSNMQSTAFILIMGIATVHGNSTTSVNFADRDACYNAARLLKEKIPDTWGDRSFIVCVPYASNSSGSEPARTSDVPSGK